MANQQYKLIPMQNTQLVSVHWRFNQSDYDKLEKGYKSNWSIFLRGDTVHVCRIGGEELYRFAMNKTSDGVYMTDNLEIYVPDDFYESARLHGWSEEKIESHQVRLRSSAVEEVAGFLANFFNINVT